MQLRPYGITRRGIVLAGGYRAYRAGRFARRFDQAQLLAQAFLGGAQVSGVSMIEAALRFAIGAGFLGESVNFSATDSRAYCSVNGTNSSDENATNASSSRPTRRRPATRPAGRSAWPRRSWACPRPSC